MAGSVISILPMTDMTLSSVGTTTASMILARHVNVTPYREGVLIARVHDKSSTSGNQTMSVTVVQAAPSADDPSTDFAATTPIATATFTLDDSMVSPSSVQFASLSAPFAPYIRVLMNYSQGTQNATMTASVSVDLVVRE